MGDPTGEAFETHAANQGITVPADLLEGAVEIHRDLRPGLEQLRRVPLAYLDAVEPETVSTWIENGGRSAPEREE